MQPYTAPTTEPSEPQILTQIGAAAVLVENELSECTPVADGVLKTCARCGFVLRDLTVGDATLVHDKDGVLCTLLQDNGSATHVWLLHVPGVDVGLLHAPGQRATAAATAGWAKRFAAHTTTVAQTYSTALLLRLARNLVYTAEAAAIHDGVDMTLVRVVVVSTESDGTTRYYDAAWAPFAKRLDAVWSAFLHRYRVQIASGGSVANEVQDVDVTDAARQAVLFRLTATTYRFHRLMVRDKNAMLRPLSTQAAVDGSGLKETGAEFLEPTRLVKGAVQSPPMISVRSNRALEAVRDKKHAGGALTVAVAIAAAAATDKEKDTIRRMWTGTSMDVAAVHSASAAYSASAGAHHPEHLSLVERVRAKLIQNGQSAHVTGV